MQIYGSVLLTYFEEIQHRLREDCRFKLFLPVIQFYFNSRYLHNNKYYNKVNKTLSMIILGDIDEHMYFSAM